VDGARRGPRRLAPKATDEIRGFRWFNDRDGKYYVTAYVDGPEGAKSFTLGSKR